ncbi:MAG: hypothetical protein PHY56_01030 [Candidatus Omnitrophica bacterium]|jgi:hypothetical protein|nr:hypothetical protein [Candidatus Omnitrophota bacterium]
MKKLKRYNVYREGKCVECGHKNKYWIANVASTTKKKAILKTKEDWRYVRFMNGDIDVDIWNMFIDAKFIAVEEK